MFEFTITVLGLLIGSFANVCIWRIPRGEEIVRTPSHCPACGAGIRWFDNLPVLGFLLLLGRCRRCHARIPWRYPAVELASAALFLSLALRFGPDWRLAGYIPFAWSLLVISAIDIERYIIPDELTYAGTGGGVAFAVAALFLPGIALTLPGAAPGWRFGPLLDSVAGLAAGGGLIALVAWLGRLWYRQEAMGGGDVKLAAMIGAVLGWQGALLAIFIGMVSGALAGLLLLALGRTKTTRELNETVYAGQPGAGPVAPKAAVPFGPFLALGALAALFCGPALLSWYAGLLR
ncbi:MAG: prepilin peptidase [Candidatus Edwardsbacteria bacterium]|jgi:leader peptidase (prepilin peptidase)/N-methyltransferase|nr:prepilin peptidase [Candidatus Edwardsbacteria bacterium]